MGKCLPEPNLGAIVQMLYAIPPLVLLVLAIGIAVALACTGQSWVHRRFKSTDFVAHNEVGGFIIAVVGTVYAVLLGFLTVVVWQNFTESKEQVSRESAAAADTWHTAVGLPYVVRSRIRQDMVEYANIMIDREWPAIHRGGTFSPDADIVVMDAMATAGSFTPDNPRESNAQLTTQEQLSVLHDERQRRVATSGGALAWFEWLVLLVGAVCVVCFCWVFGLRNPGLHLLMTSAVTVIIASMLVLLFELQDPFRSDIGIKPTTWTAFLEHVRLMQNGSQTNMRM